MKRWSIAGAVAYSIAIAFCAFGARSVPTPTQQALRGYVWLLGPPASLLHGLSYLWPFFIGTTVVAGLAFGMTREESPVAQVVCGIALLILWPFFGLLVYAPGF